MDWTGRESGVGETAQPWAGRRLGRRPELLDLAVGVGVLALLATTGYAMPSGGWLLLVAQLVALPLRWAFPLATALVIGASCLWQLTVTDGPLLSNLTVLLVIYTASAWAHPRWKAFAVLGLGLLGAVLAGLDWTRSYAGWVDGTDTYALDWGAASSQVVVLGMAVMTAWTLGDVVRRRRALLARQQAQSQAIARDRDQRVRLAAQDERASIAREMHDIVAHSLSVVVVQADGGAYAARRALEGQPATGDRSALEQAAGTLETLAATARASLADTRRLVGVLRDNDSAEYGPRQGLAQLEELVARVRGAGVPVHLTVRGEVDELDHESDLAAYRVVQESLTNVLKHAGSGTTAWVDVRHTPQVLLVRVSDDGPGGATVDGQGNGIVGMTERVQVLGGTLYAGRRTGGGFEVVASIPLDLDPPDTTLDTRDTQEQR